MTNSKQMIQSNGASGAVYGLGVIGALIYYLQRAPSLWVGIVGVAKALVWPAILVYQALRLLRL